MWVGFANAKATHIIIQQNISVCAIFNDQSFNETLTNDIVSFEQLGPAAFDTTSLLDLLGNIMWLWLFLYIFYTTDDIQEHTWSFYWLCWGFTAQSTEWGHVECGQFT